MPSTDLRAIAFYLPQYHPIAENDRWWGKGFTEWTNVARARPLFKHHYQPHIPADLGFYDLRLPEARRAQADLARAYNIYGFCYYHYWFNGKRLLERPFDEVLASGEPDFPFCLCWANENWTRAWDGGSSQILLEQHYSTDDARRHIQWLLRAFDDPRYIRVDDKPLFLVYRASIIPHCREILAIWREAAQTAGVGELYLCRVESFADEHTDPQTLGFDASVEFQPDRSVLGTGMRAGRLGHLIADLGLLGKRHKAHYVFSYASFIKKMLQKSAPAYTRFPCVTPSWDNSARHRHGALILHGSTPELYERWLTAVVNRFGSDEPELNLVFINAWNEWAEGNHLEPCLRWGHAYLEATRRALARVDRIRVHECPQHSDPVVAGEAA